MVASNVTTAASLSSRVAACVAVDAVSHRAAVCSSSGSTADNQWLLHLDTRTVCHCIMLLVRSVSAYSELYLAAAALQQHNSCVESMHAVRMCRTALGI
jgi:hypothetical protein